MGKRLVLFLVCAGLLLVGGVRDGLPQEDKVAQAAVEAIKTQMRMAKGIDVKFVEKKESPIPDFYLVKLLVSYPDRDMPVVIYVDKTGEKVIIGNLFVKGENITRKEMGQPKPRRIDMAQLETEKAPFRGVSGAKVTIVEFSNYQCPFCMKGWLKMKEVLEKQANNVRYVFKFYPMKAQEKSVNLCELAAAALEVGNDAFWAIHDFLFSEEGQNLAKGEKDPVKQKIEQILKEKGFDVKAFQTALESGKAKKRVEEDIALGEKIRVLGAPTLIVNGDYMRGPFSDRILERYLGSK